MTDLATRIPLVEKQHRVTDTDRNAKLANTYVGITQSAYLTQALRSSSVTMMMMAHKENTTVQSADVVTTEKDSTITEPHASGFISTPVSYVHAGGFRYQIRRPVESWKFVEVS
ncbi:unnamed protein product [Echinostoma caproni]|uniref:Phage protein n=1 Tax=Echinostoma caproni TaxID=27848 RepID=A0A183AS42_9TREM|nr:unnamed protein product [Echinostoma caproni]